MSEEKKESFNEKRAKFFELLQANLKANDQKQMILDLAEEVCKKAARGGKGGTRKDSKINRFKEAMIANGEMTEDQVWAEFKWGQHEALSAAWNLREKPANAEDKVWIQTEVRGEGDEAQKFYVLRGVGADKPETWVEKQKKANRVNLDDIKPEDEAGTDGSDDADPETSGDKPWD